MPSERKKSPPRGVKPTGKPASKTSTRPIARPASPPPAKRQDEAKRKKANDRLIEKAQRDAAARHAKMLAAHANRKITSQGRTPPIPTLEEFTFAFVQDRLRKSQARKRQQGDARPAKPGK